MPPLGQDASRLGGDEEDGEVADRFMRDIGSSGVRSSSMRSLTLANPRPADGPGARILLVGFLNIVASIGFARFAYTVVMPDMRDGLGLSYTQLGAIGTVGFAGYTVLSPVAGAIGAHLGGRTVIGASLLLIAAGLFGMAVTVGFATALLAYLAVQIGSAGANASGFAIATRWFPPERRGFAAGVVVAGAGAGITATGLVLPVVLATASGWRAGWALVGLAALLIAIACCRLLRDVDDADKPSALNEGRLWDRSVIGRPTLWLFAGLKGLYGFQYIIFGTFFAVHLTQGGWSIEATGRLWALTGALTVFSGLAGGWLSDRIGRLRALATMFLAQGVASLLLAADAEGPGLYVAVLLYGGTVMSSPAIAGAFCGDLVGAARASAAVGIVNFLFAIGQMLGPLAGGIAVDATGSLDAALLVASAIATVGSVASLAMATLEPRRQ